MQSLLNIESKISLSVFPSYNTIDLTVNLDHNVGYKIELAYALKVSTVHIHYNGVNVSII